MGEKICFNGYENILNCISLQAATVRSSRRNSQRRIRTDENECFKLKIMPFASSVLTSYERNTTFSDRALDFPSLSCDCLCLARARLDDRKRKLSSEFWAFINFHGDDVENALKQSGISGRSVGRLVHEKSLVDKFSVRAFVIQHRNKLW